MEPDSLQCLIEQQGAEKISPAGPAELDLIWHPHFKLLYTNLMSTSNSWGHYSYCHSSLVEGHRHHVKIFCYSHYWGATIWDEFTEMMRPAGMCEHLDLVDLASTPVSLLFQMPTSKLSENSCCCCFVPSCLDPTKPVDIHPQTKEQGGQWTCFCRP